MVKRINSYKNTYVIKPIEKVRPLDNDKKPKQSFNQDTNKKDDGRPFLEFLKQEKERLSQGRKRNL